MDDTRPLFQVVAEAVEAAIVEGSLPEGAQVPSTHELAAFHRINPATAAKGVAELVADETIFKRRGIGMFVAPGARQRLLERRRTEFSARFIGPLLAEADLLGLTRADLAALLDRAGASRPSGNDHEEGRWTSSTSPA